MRHKAVRIDGGPKTLREWRGAKKTVKQAAKELDISEGFYSHLENGSRRASGKMAERIRNRTGVPIDVLVGAARS